MIKACSTNTLEKKIRCFLEFSQSPLSSLHCSNHSRMRSKRLRTSEEPVDLDAGPALGCSKKKAASGPPLPKVRRSAAGPTCKRDEAQKKKDSNLKQNQVPNSLQLAGRSLL